MKNNSRLISIVFVVISLLLLLYVFYRAEIYHGGHKFETVKSDLKYLTKVISNGGTVVCDDYNLFQAPGVKAAIEEYILEKNFNLKILYSRFAEISKN